MLPPRTQPVLPLRPTALVWVWALGYPLVLVVMLVLFGMV